MKLVIPKLDKVVLLGGGKILLSLSKWCVLNNISIYIITSPRQAKETVQENQSFENFLKKYSIPYLVCKDINLNQTLKKLPDLSNSFCLSIGSAWIFKKNTLNETFNGRLFNLHGTRLPQNRGGGGFSWQIMMGNRLGFCQLHLIDGKIDTGNIVKTKEFLYPPSCRIPRDYEEVYLDENLLFLQEFIGELNNKKFIIETTKQLDYFSTYWPRLNTAQNGWIDWKDKVNSLERFICSFDAPYEGAKTFLNKKKVYIKDIMIDFSDPKFHDYQYGLIYRKGPSWICVCVNGGSLIIKEVLDDRKNNLFSSIKVGDRFNTPPFFLESRYNRVTYNSSGLVEGN